MKVIEAKAVDNLLYEELPMKYFYGRSLNTAVKNQAAIRERVAQIPAFDAVPVKHGYWANARTMEHDGEWYCSVCGYEPTVFENTSYCPNCGAKMDRERVSE